MQYFTALVMVGTCGNMVESLDFHKEIKKIRKDAHRQLILCIYMCFVAFFSAVKCFSQGTWKKLFSEST